MWTFSSGKDRAGAAEMLWAGTVTCEYMVVSLVVTHNHIFKSRISLLTRYHQIRFTQFFLAEMWAELSVVMTDFQGRLYKEQHFFVKGMSRQERPQPCTRALLPGFWGSFLDCCFISMSSTCWELASHRPPLHRDLQVYGHWVLPSLGHTWSVKANLHTEEISVSCIRDHWPHEGLVSSLARRLRTLVTMVM